MGDIESGRYADPQPKPDIDTTTGPDGGGSLETMRSLYLAAIERAEKAESERDALTHKLIVQDGACDGLRRRVQELEAENRELRAVVERGRDAERTNELAETARVQGDRAALLDYLRARSSRKRKAAEAARDAGTTDNPSPVNGDRR